jgi:hypothetical protein
MVGLIFMVPFALEGFRNTQSDFAGLLPKNLESARAEELLSEEFPNSSDSSIVVILKSKNTTNMNVYDDDFSKLIKGISTNLSEDTAIAEDLDINSWVSLEEATQLGFNQTIENLPNTLNETVYPLFTDFKNNISTIKGMIEDISVLAASLENLSLLFDFYLKMYYDFGRSIFYLTNLTDAYSSYFYSTDYSKIYPYWDNSTGNLSQISMLQAYIASFGSINPSITPDAVMDTFLNTLVISTINQSVNQLLAPEVVPVVNQLLLTMKASWDEAFTNETTARGSLYANLAGDPNPIPLVVGSQQQMLGRLVNVSINALMDLFAILSTDPVLQSSMQTLEGLSDLAGAFNMPVDENMITNLHSAPIEFMGLWFDLSRAVYYLANVTDAYPTATLEAGDYSTLDSYWAGVPYQLPNQDPLITGLAYSMTNSSMGPITVGEYLYSNPNIADEFFIKLVFDIFNQTAFGEWMSEYPSNPEGYLTNTSYGSLVLLNQTWKAYWQAYSAYNGVLFDDYLGISGGTDNQISQLGVLDQLIGITNKTFKQFVNTTFSSMMGTLNTSSLPPSSSPQLTIYNDTILTQLTLSIALSLIQSMGDSLPISQDSLTQAFSTSIVPTAVSYRSIGIPEAFLRNVTLEFMLGFIETNDSYMTTLFDPSAFGDTSLLGEEFNITKLIDAIDFSLILSLLYNSTIPGALITQNDVVQTLLTGLTQSIQVFVPQPTIASIPEAFIQSLISSDNSTTLIIIKFVNSDESESVGGIVPVIRKKIDTLIKSMNLENDVEYWVSGAIAQLHDSSHSMSEDLEKIDLVAIFLVLTLLSLIFLSIITPVVPK